MDTVCITTGKDTSCVGVGREYELYSSRMNWRTRALKLMKERDVTQDDLRKPLGVKTRGAVGHYLAGRRKPSIEQLTALAGVLKTTVAELTGESDPSAARGSYRGIEIADDRGGSGLCPLVSWVDAGRPASNIDQSQPAEADEWFPCPVPHSDDTFVLRVRGDSMSPEYREGELIFVDPSVEAKHGDDVVVHFGDRDETTFKQLRQEGSRAYLKPRNPNWPDQFIEVNENSRIIGVVIFSGIKRGRT